MRVTVVPAALTSMPSWPLSLALLRSSSVSVAPPLTRMPSLNLLFATLCEMTFRSEVPYDSSEVTKIAGPVPPVTTLR